MFYFYFFDLSHFFEQEEEAEKDGKKKQANEQEEAAENLLKRSAEKIADQGASAAKPVRKRKRSDPDIPDGDEDSAREPKKNKIDIVEFVLLCSPSTFSLRLTYLLFRFLQIKATQDVELERAKLAMKKEKEDKYLELEMKKVEVQKYAEENRRLEIEAKNKETASKHEEMMEMLRNMKK